MNSESILDSTKKTLGLVPEYDVFDLDIVMHINTVFFTLNQLGIGPAEGYSIQDEHDEWSTFLGTDPLLNSVKSYMYLRVKLLFDPPDRSYVLEALKQQIQELEWRLSAYRESKITTTVTLVSDT